MGNRESDQFSALTEEVSLFQMLFDYVSEDNRSPVIIHNTYSSDI